MKTYTAKSDIEAKALHDGTQTLLVIPVRKQPPDGSCPTSEWVNGGSVYRKDHGVGSYSLWFVPGKEEAPYSPGERIGVKEAVATDGPWNLPEGCHYWYPADGGGQPTGYQRSSAMRAPIKTIRTHLLVKGVECRQVQETTEKQILACGICLPPTELFPTINTEDKLRERLSWVWDRRHPKQLWASNPWAWFIKVVRDEKA